MDLEKRIEELGKRVAELEVRVQEQPNSEAYKYTVFSNLNIAQHLINETLPLIVTKKELFSSKPTSQSASNSNGNI